MHRFFSSCSSVASKFEYCNAVWNPYHNCHSNSIELSQKKFLLGALELFLPQARRTMYCHRVRPAVGFYICSCTFFPTFNMLYLLINIMNRFRFTQINKKYCTWMLGWNGTSEAERFSTDVNMVECYNNGQKNNWFSLALTFFNVQIK